MRIVLVAPAVPLPFGRADARWLHSLLLELPRRDIDVTCISYVEDDDATIAAAHRHVATLGAHLVTVPVEVERSVLRRKAASLRRPFSESARSATLCAAIEAETRRGYDVLHVEHVFNGWLLNHHARSVLYLHHLEVVDWEDRADMSLRERQILLQMRRATRSILRRSPHVIVASTRLAADVRRLGGPSAAVVPIGLDLALYPMVPALEDPVVGLIGSMHWTPSRRAAERLLDLWPRILAAVPEAQLVVAGWNARRYLGGRLPMPGVTLLDAVEDPRDFFARVALLVYPTPRGSGMKVKVLESMAYGVPVISNQEGFEGLPIANGLNAVLAETDDEFVGAAVALLLDVDRRFSVRREARGLVDRKLAPGPSVDRLLDAYARFGLVAA